MWLFNSDTSDDVAAALVFTGVGMGVYLLGKRSLAKQREALLPTYAPAPMPFAESAPDEESYFQPRSGRGTCR